MKNFVFILFLVINATKKSHTLQCYVCHDCDNLANVKPEFCGPETTRKDTEKTLISSYNSPRTYGRTFTTTPEPEPTPQDPEWNYACFKIDLKGFNGTKRERGCVEYNTSDNICEVIRNKTEIEVQTSNCEFCFQDGCNGSPSMKFPVVILFVIFAIKLLI